MKKILLSTILISGILFNANAQEGGLEIRAGYASSTTRTVFKNTTTRGDAASGFNIGALFSKIDEGKGVELGLLYSHFIEDDYTASYLTLPVMPKYYVGEAMNFLLGAQFDFQLGASQNGNSINIKDNGIKNTNISLGLGAGYEVGSIALSARYFWGVKNLLENGDSDNKLKTNTFQLSLGLKL